MSAVLEGSEVWTGEDVGAFVVNQIDGGQEIHFFLNVDNGGLREAERRVARRQSEAAVDAVREYHRTLLCLHLYGLAKSEDERSGEDAPIGYAVYRSEMIRVNDTLLFGQREFLAAKDLEEEVATPV